VRNFLLIYLFLLFAGCSIEEARPHSENQLTLAQNFMTAAQKQVLLKMAKRRNLNLSIIALSPSEIRKALHKQPWEPGFDLIMLDGVQAQKALNGLAFQYHQAAFAAIPIGISYLPDSVVKVRNFSDLSRHYLWSAADDKVQTLLKAHLDYVYRGRATNQQLNKTYQNLIRGFKDHKLAFDKYQLLNTLLLCRYDTYLNVLKKAVKKRRFTFALADKDRYYADYISLSIIEQSANYHAAQQFKRYLTFMRDNNAAFREAFGMAEKQVLKKQPTAQQLLQYLEK
jgi:hypothetical protein